MLAFAKIAQQGNIINPESRDEYDDINPLGNHSQQIRQITYSTYEYVGSLPSEIFTSIKIINYGVNDGKRVNNFELPECSVLYAFTTPMSSTRTYNLKFLTISRLSYFSYKYLPILPTEGASFFRNETKYSINLPKKRSGALSQFTRSILPNASLRIIHLKYNTFQHDHSPVPDAVYPFCSYCLSYVYHLRGLGTSSSFSNTLLYDVHVLL